MRNQNYTMQTTDDKRAALLNSGRSVDGKFAPGKATFKRAMYPTQKQIAARQQAMDWMNGNDEPLFN